MEQNVRRRTLLASLGAGIAGSLAGCEALPFGGDSPPAGPGAIGWPLPRGTPGNTGASASVGPDASASEAFTAELRDGVKTGRRPPIVGDDGIYAVAMESEPYTHDPVYFALYAYKLSTDDGSETWRQTVLEAEGEEQFNHIGSPRAALDRDSLYLVNRDSDTPKAEFYAISRADGSTRWEQEIEGYLTQSQPIVGNGMVYAFVERQVVALDVGDGSEQWRSPPLSLSQPYPSVGRDGIALYNDGVEQEMTEGQLSVLDPSDGSVRWSEPFPNARQPIPTVAEDTVFLADGDQFGTYGLSRAGPSEQPRRKIHARALADGTERWTHTYETDEIKESATGGGTGFVTVTPDHVYYALGFLNAREIVGPEAPEAEIEPIREMLYHGPNVVALNRTTGEVVWRQTLGDQARIFRPMIAGSDALYALYQGNDEESSQVYVLDRGDGSVRGSFGPLPADMWRSFAVADGTIYTHHQDSIRAWR